MEPLNELSLRKPEFTQGCQVVLGDGQTWTFPRAVLRWYPAISPKGSVEVKRSPPFGPEFQAKVDRLVELINGGDEVANERETQLIVLAGELLLRNYDLDEAAMERLLPYCNDEAVVAMWGQLYDVILGRAAPKPSTAA